MTTLFKTTVLNIFVLTLTLSMGSFALAASKTKAESSDKKPPMEITAEQRQQMAGMHEKMATCLRSDKSMDDCHSEMMATHKDFKDQGSCPMHGMHGKKGGSCCAGGKSGKKKGGSCCSGEGGAQCADHHAHQGEKTDAPATEKK